MSYLKTLKVYDIFGKLEGIPTKSEDKPSISSKKDFCIHIFHLPKYWNLNTISGTR